MGEPSLVNLVPSLTIIFKARGDKFSKVIYVKVMHLLLFKCCDGAIRQYFIQIFITLLLCCQSSTEDK